MLHKLLVFTSDHFVGLIMAIAGLFVYARVSTRKGHQKNARKLLQKAIATDAAEPITLHPEIDPSKCGGCGACTRVCPEGDILKLIDHKAVLVAPTKCVGHGECELACPFDAIDLVFGTKSRGMDIPRISSNYETNVPGLYIAGELGGMGLIRNAVKQGTLAATHALEHLPKEKADYDLLIVGAGPAGFTAALTAIAKKSSYLCIDQNTLGGAIANFPRQKVVMSYPLILPIVGEKKFPSHKISKESLLSHFKDIQGRTGLKIKENCKFESLEKIGEIFRVKTSTGEMTAKRVILAMGVRGSPRRLGVPGEDTDKVTYNLLDPEQYQERDIIVVGGGNAGVEAAQSLGNPKWRNRVHLMIRGQDFDRCNETNRKIIMDMAEKKQVTIMRHSQIKEVHSDHVIAEQNGTRLEMKNDFVFVFAGAEMPHKFLMSLGIKIDKKFGEALAG